MWEQVIVYGCVAVAALYLGKYVYDSIAAIVKARSGCGEGCGKCAFAAQPAKPKAGARASAPGSIIPLTDIRSIPRKRE